MLHCALISSNETVRRQVTAAVGRAQSNAEISLDVPTSADQLSREAVARIVAAGPQLAFLDLGDSTTGMRVVQALGEDAPEIRLIVTGPPLEAEDLLAVMRSGAAEYLPQPTEEDDVAGALHRVRRKLGVSPAPADARGRVISVFSAKGGTGVTTIAANLAVVVAHRAEGPVLLLDLNPSFGTAELALGLSPRYSYLDVVQNFHRMDAELFESFLEEHESGVSLLAAPAVDTGGDELPPDQVVSLLRLARRHFPHVVVDAGNRVGTLTTHILDESDDVLVVATPEVQVLRNLKRAQEHFHLRSVAGPEGYRIILNQRRPGMGVTDREVEDVLQQRVFATVDWDDEPVLRSLDMGEPLGESGRSRFARGMASIGDGLFGTNGKSGGPFSFLKSLRPSSGK